LLVAPDVPAWLARVGGLPDEIRRNGRLGHVTIHLPTARHLPRVDVQAQFDFLPAPLASPSPTHLIFVVFMIGSLHRRVMSSLGASKVPDRVIASRRKV